MSNTQKSTRRDFLKTSGVVAAGTGLAGSLGVTRGAHAAGDDLIKVALIGCGGRGRGAVAQRIKVGDNCKVVAVADAFEDKARSAKKQFDALAQKDPFKGKVDIPEENVFWGFDAYKKAIDSCDQILIATSPGFRPIHYKYAIEQGKPVFMEKPLCTDAKGFRMLMDTNKLADEKGLSVVVGLQRHYEKKYQDMIENVWNGAIGDPMFARVYWNGGGVWGNRPLLRGEDETEMYHQMRSWYYYAWLSGDNITEQHVHNIDIGNWALGGENVMDRHPVRVNGMGGRQVRTDKGFGYIYDHHFCEFTFANGTKMYSQCRHIPNCMNQVNEFIYGTNGYANRSGIVKGNIPADDRGVKWDMTFGNEKMKNYSGDYETANPYEIEHIELVKAIRGDKPQFNDGYFGALSSFTACLGRLATYSGKVIEWDEAVNNGVDEMVYADDISWQMDPPVMPEEDGSYPIPMPGVWKPLKG
jgi:predicted dehydrogenase